MVCLLHSLIFYLFAYSQNLNPSTALYPKPIQGDDNFTMLHKQDEWTAASPTDLTPLLGEAQQSARPGTPALGDAVVAPAEGGAPRHHILHVTLVVSLRHTLCRAQTPAVLITSDSSVITNTLLH